MKNLGLKSSTKMIKLFSLCLALCLIMTSFAVFAADETETTEPAAETTETAESTENTEETTPDPDVPVYGEDSYGLLNALGIANISEGQLTSTIKRADLLVMMAKAAGYTGVTSEVQLFADLPVTDEREPMLRALAQAGIISPNAKGNIIPDGPVTLAEAAAVAVSLTGYSIVADSRGGYPSGYYAVAKTNGILKGVPSGQNTVLTTGMAAKLIENLLKADLMLQSGFGTTGTTYEERVGQNLLYTVHHVLWIEDVLENVDITRLMGKNDVETFYIEIGGMEIEARKLKTEVYEYLGYRVNAYYTDIRGDYPKLIHIAKTANNSETVIKAEDIEEISNGRIVVYDEATDGRKNYSYSRSLPVIYNGVSTRDAFSEDMIDGKGGSITLVDNTGDKAPDVIFVDVYETLVVSQIDTKESIVYDMYDVNHKVKLDTKVDDPFTTIYNAAGEASSLGQIKSGDVLAVFSSADDAYQKYINVYIVRNKIAGTIERIKEGGKKIIVNGTEYELTEQCRAEFAKLFAPGQAVELTFDYDGIVCYAKKTDTAMGYGYLAAASHEGGGLKGKLKFKIYPVGGTGLVIYEAADSIKIDGEKYESSDDGVIERLNKASKETYGATTPDDSTASMVRFSLNADSKVNVIDTVLNSEGNAAARKDVLEADDSLFFVSDTTGVYRRTNYTLGSKITVAKETPVMICPIPGKQDTQDEEFYIVGSEPLLKHNLAYSDGAIAYYTSPESYNAEILVCNYGQKLFESVEENVGFSVVVETGSALNKSDGKVYDTVGVSLGGSSVDHKYVKDGFTFKGFKDGGDTIDDDATVDTLRCGDVIKYSVDKDGFIVTLKLYFSPSRNMAVEAPPSTAYRSGIRMVYGYAYDKFDNGFLMHYSTTPFTEVPNFDDPKNEETYVTYEDCELVMNTAASATYYIYNEDGKDGEPEITSTSFDGLKSYLDTGYDCSRFFIQQNYGTPVAVLIY